MKTQRRWAASVVAETTKQAPKLPWARGAERAKWKARVAARLTKVPSSSE